MGGFNCLKLTLSGGGSKLVSCVVEHVGVTIRGCLGDQSSHFKNRQEWSANTLDNERGGDKPRLQRQSFVGIWGGESGDAWWH